MLHRFGLTEPHRRYPRGVVGATLPKKILRHVGPRILLQTSREDALLSSAVSHTNDIPGIHFSFSFFLHIPVNVTHFIYSGEINVNKNPSAPRSIKTEFYSPESLPRS